MNLSKARVLVTGGAGFIGSHLTEQLVSAGAFVTVVDNLCTGRLENLSRVQGRYDFVELNIRKLPWKDYLIDHQFDVIFHLAGNAYVPPSVKRPAWDRRINFGESFRLLENLRKIKWPGALIYASSAAVYGDPFRIPIHEDDPLIPISPYGVGKLAAERYTNVYSRLYGLRAASLRFFSLYGPRQRKQVVYDLIRKVKKTENELSIFGDGSQVRDFNFVDDAARAAMIVAKNGSLNGEVYNVASGREYSIQALAETICSVMGVHPKFVYSGSVRPGDPEKWSVDIGRLVNLGYRPQVTLQEGIKRTVEWVGSMDGI
jgi:UDP-glucose 4-epimerase